MVRKTRAIHLPGIPSDKHYPWFGALLTAYPRLHELLDVIQEGFDAYGMTYQASVPMQTGASVLTVDPKNVEYMLKTNFYNYIKGPMVNVYLDEFLGKGIFNSDGHDWLTQRRTASHMFTMRSLKDHMSKVFIEHGQNLLNKLAPHVDKANEFIDMQSFFYDFTFQSICEIAFSLHGSEPEATHQFMLAFDRCQYQIEQRWFDPTWRLKRFGAKFGVRSAEYRFRQDLKYVNEFAYDIIKKRRAEIARADSEQTFDRSDLLSLFLSKTDENPFLINI
jgi:cytochrome P450